jgi:hypothetical protein
MIIASRASSVAHTMLTEWLNRELENRTVGFWNELSDEIHGQILFSEVTVLVVELYYANRTTMTGFIVLSNLNLRRPRMTVFDAAGEPVYYNEQDTEFIIQVTETGDVTHFIAGEHIPLFDVDNTQMGTVYLHLENNWGTYLPIVHVDVGATPLGAGLLDVVYDDRDSGAYKVVVEPDSDAVRYLVENISGQLLDMTVPLFPNYHLPIRLDIAQSVYVPVTENSTYYLADLENRKLVRVSGPEGL